MRKISAEKNLNDTIKIVDALKAKGAGKTITSAQLETLTGIYRNRVKELLKEEMAINPNITSIPRKGYQWVEKQNPEETKKEEPKTVERYDDTKNDEGYMDMTAFLAMQTITDDRYKQEPGQIWEFEGTPYKYKDLNWCVILKAYGKPDKGSCSFLLVSKIDDYYDEKVCVPFSIKGNLYYVDPRRVQQRPIKSLIRSKYRLEDKDFNEIKEAVAKHLDILQNTKIIEKKIPGETIIETKEVPAQITEEDAIAFLTNSGWLKKHEVEIVNQMCAEASVESSIEVLTESGWLAKHDAEKMDAALTTMNIMKRQYAEAEAAKNAYREALYLFCGKEVVAS